MNAGWDEALLKIELGELKARRLRPRADRVWRARALFADKTAARTRPLSSNCGAAGSTDRQARMQMKHFGIVVGLPADGCLEGGKMGQGDRRRAQRRVR